ncbi:MAG: hypothetical protein H8E66_11050 [Planctomycetes bacterium]|nr:hypothetical protein [Planctomycetota bacterium]
MKFESAILFASCLYSAGIAFSAEPVGSTTLRKSTIQYKVATEPYVILERAGVRAVIVDNQSVDDEVLSGHQAGYNGVAALSHAKQSKNLFVPSYSGLNFEAIHDGTVQEEAVLFEPRRAPMQLRVIDEFTCELYQHATPNWRLESCHRYHMLRDGTIEITFECKPVDATFANKYIGLQWASYINQPKSLGIYFKGHPVNDDSRNTRWILATTPGHGRLSTHLATNDQRVFPHDKDFPFTLLFSRSNYRFSQPWYFGKCRGMALVTMYRPEDMIRFTQSPSGGGGGNPAWDYQLLISDYRPGAIYQMVMRVMYTPFESIESIEQLTLLHRKALGQIP